MAASRLTFEVAPKRTRVLLRGVAIAESSAVVLLTEGASSPVRYFPRQDVDPAALVRTAHSSRCPWKGEASYFTLQAGGEQVVNAAWSYEQPIEAAAPISGHIAFYPQHVTFETLD